MGAISTEWQPPRLGRKEASTYLRKTHGVTVAASTLAKLASVGGGPAFSKFCGRAFYDLEALDSWVLTSLRGA